MTQIDQWLKLRDAVSQLDNSLKLIAEEVMDKNWTDTKRKKEFINWYPSHAAILKDWLEMIDTVSNENSKYKSRFSARQLAGTIRGVGRMLDTDFYWSRHREMMNSAADNVYNIAILLHNSTEAEGSISRTGEWFMALYKKVDPVSGLRSFRF